MSPQKLEKQCSLVTMATAEFKDIVLYLADIGLTLKSFVEVYPAACQAFHDNEFIQKYTFISVNFLKMNGYTFRGNNSDIFIIASLLNGGQLLIERKNLPTEANCFLKK